MKLADPWVAQDAFTAEEAAGLMVHGAGYVGSPEQKVAAKPYLDRITEAHRVFRAALTGPGPIRERRQILGSGLFQDALGSRYLRAQMAIQGDWEADQATRRVAGPAGELDQQHFERQELARWLAAIGLPSAYAFIAEVPSSRRDDVVSASSPATSTTAKRGNVGRANALTQIIKQILNEVGDGADNTAIWRAFVIHAQNQTTPLRGVEGDRVKYLAADGVKTTTIGKKDFLQRVKRAAG